jgi:hypothetical protein
MLLPLARYRGVARPAPRITQKPELSQAARFNACQFKGLSHRHLSGITMKEKHFHILLTRGHPSKHTDDVNNMLRFG